MKIITDELKQQIIEYYKTHSNTDTGNYFHIHFSPRISNMLIDNRIPLHTKEENERFRQEKRKRTCLSIYGCEYSWQAESVKKKANNTKIKKYGRANIGQFGTQEHTNSIQAKYGVDNPAQAENIKKCIKQTNFEKYGATCSLQNIFIKEQTIKTNLQKYGVSCYLKTDDCKLAQKQIMINKYGKEHYLQTRKGLKTYNDTCMSRYGVEWYQQTEEARQKARKRYFVKKDLIIELSRKSRKKNYTFKDLTFDSLPELAFYICMLERSADIEREPCKFEYEFSGKTHTYFPDFRVNGKLYEIKGDQFLNKDGTWRNPFDRSKDALWEAKRQCAIKNGVTILYSDNYEKYINEFISKYDPKDFNNSNNV